MVRVASKAKQPRQAPLRDVVTVVGEPLQRRLGLTLPPPLLALADEVIE
jgi:hypothetical protein